MALLERVELIERFIRSFTLALRDYGETLEARQGQKERARPSKGDERLEIWNFCTGEVGTRSAISNFEIQSRHTQINKIQ